MYRKGEFSKIKESICNIPKEAANICHILPRPAVSIWLIVIKLKRDLKYRIRVYFEPAQPHIIYPALAYLKSHNKFYTDNSIDLSREEIFRFSTIVEGQWENESVSEKIIFDGTDEMSESVNGSETEYASVEDPLSMQRIASNETTLISDIHSKHS